MYNRFLPAPLTRSLPSSWESDVCLKMTWFCPIVRRYDGLDQKRRRCSELHLNWHWQNVAKTASARCDVSQTALVRRNCVHTNPEMSRFISLIYHVLDAFSHLYKIACSPGRPFVHSFIRPTQVEALEKNPFLGKIRAKEH